MRAWRSPEGFVVELGVSPEPLVAPLEAELPVKNPRDYVRLDARGSLIARCAVQTWSVEDELGASACEVVDGDLRRVSVSLFTTDRIERDLTVVVEGLQEVPLDTVPFREFAQKEARRVAAVDYGPQVRRVQEILGPRARHALDVEMLRLLEHFAERKLQPALDSFVRVCLIARGVEGVDETPVPADPWAERLAALGAWMRRDAEAWERFGGDDIARDLRRAARLLP